MNKSRNKKKAESEEGSTKGYDDMCAMIQGLLEEISKKFERHICQISDKKWR